MHFMQGALLFINRCSCLFGLGRDAARMQAIVSHTASTVPQFSEGMDLDMGISYSL